MTPDPTIPIDFDGRRRVVITAVTPEIDDGRFAIKRTVNEPVVVEADIFADGHDLLSAELLFRAENEQEWKNVPMEALPNDRWRGSFTISNLVPHRYSVMAWIDHFKTWRSDLQKKVQAKMDVALDLLAGAQLLREAATRANATDAVHLVSWAKELSAVAVEANTSRIGLALSAGLSDLMARYPDRDLATLYGRQLRVSADRPLARFGAWYEMFPRSFAHDAGRHGTFKEFERQLERVAAMGFDILYLAPIHPIGRSFRKGKNNRPAADGGDHGSTWAIGAAEGGHKSIHSELGTLEDFRHLVAAARTYNLEVALDVAFQCAPDHPYVTEHPEWFRKRPDGTIQYAENPPKKYQDIYPFDFEAEDWWGLWGELKSVFEYWIDQGIFIFRVDNPHTKAFPFWKWVLEELKAKHPELIFLAEAFTRPKVMYHLAKIGFTQSYNYFPWRNTKVELTDYFTELTRTELREYFRPNLWPNTPDILPQYLQYGGRAAFVVRLILAATLGASYGIYGPAFELCESRPREIGSEEYLNSEKYELKRWDLNRPGNLTDLVAQVNRIRRENPALQSNDSLVFHGVDNEQIIAYSKQTDDLANIIVTVVNLDPHHTQSSFVHLNLDAFKVQANDTYQVHDLLTGARYLWQGSRNFVELNPQFASAHIFRLRRRARSEQDFDTFV